MLLLREGHPGLALELKTPLPWQLRDCRMTDCMHKSLVPSISSSMVVETGLKVIAAAALHLVSLHFSVLCSITQHTLVAAFLQVSQ